MSFIVAGAIVLAASAFASTVTNSTYNNPILPGFHPDPSCIFVNHTVFCASSSFNAFPGIPIHASRDLQNWKLIGNAFSRAEMLPALATTNRSTGGIWAPTLRYHENKFWISTTLVFDDLPKDNASRWDNFVIHSSNPYDSFSWSDPVHFKFEGYDTSLFWEDDGQVHVVGSHQYTVWPGIQMATIDLSTGALGPLLNPWNGTGGLAPEGPHVYKKDGYYYLMLAEGGTGLGHMVTMARSKSLTGPYTPAPRNPLLTNANTTAFFQTVGHADLFQDGSGNWWAAALSTRSGPEFLNYPMGRETVMTPVSWPKGEFPVFEAVSGSMNGWHLPAPALISEGAGPYINDPDHFTFAPGSTLPLNLIHWRLPTPDTYLVSPPGHVNQLVVKSSVLNLTSLDGYFTGGQGQSFIGRRQTHNLCIFTVDIDASGVKEEEDEAGVAMFLVQRYHAELGVVMLPDNASNATTGLTPHFRFRGMSGVSLPDAVFPVPSGVDLHAVTFQINAFNWTHFAFSAGAKGKQHALQTYGYGQGAQMSWGFTGTLAGVYATTNGRVDSKNGAFEVGVSEWKYQGIGQVLD